jgi:hypothetical protein
MPNDVVEHVAIHRKNLLAEAAGLFKRKIKH